jgi:hypothetical protein
MDPWNVIKMYVCMCQLWYGQIKGSRNWFKDITCVKVNIRLQNFNKLCNLIFYCIIDFLIWKANLDVQLQCIKLSLFCLLLTGLK